MTPADVIRLAKLAGLWQEGRDGWEAKGFANELLIFAQLVTEADQEACAKLCEERAAAGSDTCAKFIRARVKPSENL